MKYLLILCVVSISACSGSQLSQKYLFYLHHRFIELEGVNGFHHEYGGVEYAATVRAFENAGFIVLSEVRPRDTDARAYAEKVQHEVDSLLDRGVSPADITIVGASKGGYIAMYASSFLKNSDLNFVLVGCCDTVDMPAIPDFDLYGNILSIYEESDTFATSCVNVMKKYAKNMPRYEELRLETGLKHAFLYKALPDWIEPSMAWAQKEPLRKPKLAMLLDSVLADTVGLSPFNGIVLITEADRTVYGRALGYADIPNRTPLNLTDQVIIGSLSKQITAAMVLREYEKGRLQLHSPIGTYLPDLKLPWKDSVTINHLLTHTHGIKSLDAPLAWEAGSAFEYGNIGYVLAGKILEHVTGKSVAELSHEVFALAGMRHSTFPGLEKDSHRASGHEASSGGVITGIPARAIGSAFVPAGGFISTAIDLAAWNQTLHHGKLLADSTYTLMTTPKPNAIRPHPALDTMDYGYGVQMKEHMVGHTGFAPGYVSLNFYFPKGRTSVIVLENLAAADFKEAYMYHARILKTVESYLEP